MLSLEPNDDGRFRTQKGAVTENTAALQWSLQNIMRILYTFKTFQTLLTSSDSCFGRTESFCSLHFYNVAEPGQCRSRGRTSPAASRTLLVLIRPDQSHPLLGLPIPTQLISNRLIQVEHRVQQVWQRHKAQLNVI